MEKHIRSGFVISVCRALNILNVLSQNKYGLSLKEISEFTRLPSSTAHRLLTTLESEYYVRFENQSKLWLIGTQARTVGNAFEQVLEIDALVDLTDHNQNTDLACKDERHAS